MSMIDVKKPKQVSTATTVALGLIGGWVTAKETGIRPLGGVILGAAGIWAGRSWLDKTNPATTATLSALYLGAFGASHPSLRRLERGRLSLP